MSLRSLSFDDYIEDPELGGFSLSDISTFLYQLTAYRAADAMPPRPGDLERFTEMTGRTQWPTEPSPEIHHNWCRRSGKSLLEMHRAVWHAIDDSHLDSLARGERVLIRVTCPSKQQSQDSFGFLLGIFEAPMLSPLVERTTQDTVSLRNRVDIRVTPASFRTSRGGSTKAWFFDEACYLYVDGLNALPELLAAAQPSLATIKGSRLYLLSSVYDQSTAMAEAKRRYWGVNDAPVLVTVGGFEILRPDLKATVEVAMARDPERARAEWYSQERSDLAAAFLEQWVDDAMILEDRPIPRGVLSASRFHGFFDASGGARDAAAFAIAIVEPGTEPRATVVFQRRWPAPHSPVAVISEAAEICRGYGISTVCGDRYAAGFTLDAFAAKGISYLASEQSRSALYLELIPLLAVGRVQLPRNERLRRELVALQRRTRSAGKDIVDHPVGGSDDLSNAVAGAVVHAWRAAAKSENADQVLPADWVRQAQARWQPQAPYGIPMCAIGVGIRGLSNPVLAIRYDGWYAPLILASDVRHGRDLSAFILKHRRNQSLPVLDCGESLGAQASTHLEENRLESSAFLATDETTERTAEKQLGFADRRSAAYWRFREALDPDQDGGSPVSLPDDPELVSQLEAITWTLTTTGIRVVTKEHVEERLQRPATRADAVVLAWYRGDRAKTHIQVWQPDARVPIRNMSTHVRSDFGPRHARSPLKR